MYYFKNITLSVIQIPTLGIVLDPAEVREFSEIASREVLQNNSTIINDLIYNDQLSVLDAELNAFTKVVSAQIISNAYDTISVVSTIADPVIVAQVPETQKFYFIKDEWKMSRNVTYVKSFLGDIDTLYVFAQDSDITLVIKANGLVFPTEYIMKNQTFEFDFKDITENFSIEIKSKKNNKDVEIFMDGKSSADTVTLQNFIDTWREV